MATRTIQTKLELSGEAEYKRSLSEINSEYKTLQSELKLVESQYKGNANSMEALQARGETLSAMYASQEKKLATLNNALEDAKRAQQSHADTSEKYKKQIAEAEDELEKLKNTSGDTSAEQEKLKNKIAALNDQLAESEKKEASATKSVNSWQRQVNNAQVDLNNLNDEIKNNDKHLEEAKNSTDGCATSIDKYGKEVKQAGEETEKSQKKTKEMSGSVEDLSAVLASAGIAASVKEIAQAFWDAAQAAFTFADDIATLSAQTGIGTDDLQAYSYAAELVDVSVETLTKSMAKNIKSMASARDGSASYKAAYEALGVSVTTVDGQLRDSEQVYWELIDALSKIDNETDRDALAMQLLGKSAQDLNPLILAGSAAMQEYAAEARSAGYIMSEDTLESAIALSDSFERMKVSSDALRNTIGVQLAPSFEKLTTAGTDALQWITNFLQENEDIVPILSSVAAGAGSYLAVVAGFVIISKIIPLIHALNAALLANPFVAAAAAAVGLAAAFVTLKQNTEQMPEEMQAAIDGAAGLADAYQETRAAIEDSSATNRTYADELAKLAAKENKSASDKAMMLEYINRLNAAVPNLSLAYDEVADSINMSGDAISDMLAQAEGYDRYTAAVQLLADSQAEATELDLARKEAEEELADAQDRLNLAVSSGSEAAYLYLDAQAQAQERLDAVTAAQDTLNEEIERATADIEAYSAAVTESSGIDEDRRARINALSEQIAALSIEYTDAKNAALDSINSQIGIWEQMDNTAKTSAQTLNDALLSQITYLANYEANMNSLLSRNVEGVDQLALKFSDGSAESAAALSGLAEASDDEIAAIIENMESVEEGKNAFSRNMAELQTDFSDRMADIIAESGLSVQDVITAMDQAAGFEAVGEQDAEGYRIGLQNKKGAIMQTAIEIARDTQAAMRNASDQHSPSKAYAKIADNDAAGYIVGWQRSRDAILHAIEEQGALNLSAMRTPTDEIVESSMRAAQQISNNYNGGNATITVEMHNTFSGYSGDAGDEIASDLIRRINRELGRSY